MDDSDLLATVKKRMTNGLFGASPELTRNRLRNLRFYRGYEPVPLHQGNASYVSRDVFDAVEGRKASLMEAFTGNAKPVKFAPTNPDDVQVAQIATDYTDYVVMRQNDGYGLMHDAIYYGLLARTAIAQIHWEKSKKELKYSLENQTQDAVQAILLRHQDSLVDFEIEKDEKTGLVSVEYTLEADQSQVRMEIIPPEEFGVADGTTSLETTPACWRRKVRTLSWLRSQGYSNDLLDDLASSGDEMTSTTIDDSGEWYARHCDVSSGEPLGDDPYRRTVVVTECYVRIADGDDAEGPEKLYRVVLANDTILEREEVRDHPYAAYSPMRVPNRFWGDDFANSVVPIQIAQTLLRRSIIDHAMITNNPRWTVLKGGLVNVRELVENRLGGVVNVTRPDAVGVLPQSAMNPMVLSIIDRLDNDKQTITGTSDLQQGLSKDVISSQNSADLVQQMATLGQTRAKLMARNFAEFVRRVYLKSYNLVVENAKASDVIEVAGNWVQVDPRDWEERKLVTVEFAIGYNEREKEAASLFQFDQYMSAQPNMAPIYTLGNRFNVWSDILRLNGRYDISRYLGSPDQVPPPQPNPAEVQEMQLKEREMAVKEANAQTAASAAQTKQMAAVSKGEASSLGNALKVQGSQLKVAQFTHQQEVDASELALQAAALRQGHLQAMAKLTQTSGKP